MTFAQPQLLWLLLLLPLAGLFWLWAGNRRREALARLGDPALIERLSMSVNRNGRRWQRRLWFLALAFLILALARPQWGSQVQVVEQEGVQVMVVLDVSKSMLAQDLKPDRLTRARLEISDLMSRLDGDEIGLVLFSGASFIQFPLTSDYDTARAFLDNARPEVISRPGTAVADAIETAMSGFDPQRSSQKVIVIMTDGEDHEGDPIAAAQQAAADGAIIYTIGFGSAQGEPIPEFDADGRLVGYKKDGNGEVVLSRLDEVTLQRIAQTANGRYFRARADGSELRELAAELDDLQAEQLQTRFETQKIERFQLFLLVTLASMFISELIPERIRRKERSRRAGKLSRPRSWLPLRMILFVLVFLLGGCAPSAGRLLAKGNKAFADGAYDRALEAYSKAQEVTPEAAEPLYDSANVYYRQEAYQEAGTLLQQALGYAQEELAQFAQYNLGNVYFQQEQWDAAVEAYKEALRRNPDDQDAKYNLELALQRSQDQQQQDQQQNQQNQDGQDQKQDQSSPDQQNQDQQQDQQAQRQPDQGQQQNPSDQSASDQSRTDQGQSNQGQPQQVKGLTEEQARQLLDAIGKDTKTLQERLQQIFVAPGAPPEKDW
ncbi:MAG: VWA domain-containing protein [Anaerolineae bacterium]